MKTFGIDSRELLVQTSLQKLTIDTKWHADEVKELNIKNNEFGELVQLSLHDIVQVR
jgi:hypothetical protein